MARFKEAHCALLSITGDIMEPQYWLSRWQTGDIGFDQAQPNTNLVTYLSALDLRDGAHIFVPLCGKSIDVIWLLEQGFEITGVELSQSAVQSLFAGLEIEPTVEKNGDHTCYHHGNLRIFVGDIFDLTAQQLGEVSAIYDRAALVALPYDLRVKYANKLCELCPIANQLVVTVEYPQPDADSTPQSITHDHMNELYAHQYDLDLLANKGVSEGIKGCHPAFNATWHLVRK
ncbi:thiopurine S-methyltransferase [Pseudoalteromonas pernae]|uniref:thiopurine S-methyltransferase n=1 Tax=Pseudoalteromonas pernae TaxID=3118054 RepID=UPI003241BB5B